MTAVSFWESQRLERDSRPYNRKALKEMSPLFVGGVYSESHMDAFIAVMKGSRLDDAYDWPTDDRQGQTEEQDRKQFARSLLDPGKQVKTHYPRSVNQQHKTGPTRRQETDNLRTL